MFCVLSSLRVDPRLLERQRLSLGLHWSTAGVSDQVSVHTCHQLTSGCEESGVALVCGLQVEVKSITLLPHFY